MLLTALLLAVLTPWESAAQARDGQPRLRRASRLTEEAQKQRISKLMSAGDKEALMVTLDRVTLHLTRDLSAELSAGRSPLMIKGIGVRVPLSAHLADWIEARVSALLHQSGQRVVFCVACRAQQTSITDEA